MKHRGLVLVVVMIVAALTAAPALSATKTDKKQNKALKALKKRTNELRSGLDAADFGLAQLGGELTKLSGDLGQLDDALKDGLQEAAASVTALDNLFTGYVNSSEYGVVQLYFDSEGDGFEANDALPGQLLTTADIPDNADQATVTGKLFFNVPDGTTAKPIALKAGVRSGEGDGTGGADPAGQAGLMAMTAEIIGAPGTTSVGGGNPGAPATLPLTSKPNTSLAGAPVYDIPGKAPLTGAPANPFAFPNDQMIELTDPTTLQTLTSTPTRFTVSNSSGSTAVAIVNVTARFHDLSTSTTDLEE